MDTITAPSAPTAPTVVHRGVQVRTVGVRLLAVAFAVLFALPGVAKLFSAWFEADPGGHRIHHLGEGIHSAVIILAACLAIVIGRASAAGVHQLLAGVFLPLPLIVVGGLVTDPVFIGIWVALMAALIWVHPDRTRLFRGARPSLPMLLLAGVAAVPLGWLSWTQLRLQLVLPDIEPHAAVGHWAGTAFLAAAVALLALLAALRAPGWRLPLWSAATALGLWAVASLLFPAAASTLNMTWAIAALAWLVAFVTAGLRSWQDAPS
jgi:hypothetical protein